MEIQQAFPTLQRKFSQLVEAGVPFGTGTDNGSPGNFHYGSIWLEMRIWSEWGVPPETIIEAATSRGAEALGLDDIGRIAEGARADLVIYSGDILNGDFSADRVDAVTKGGVLYR